MIRKLKSPEFINPFFMNQLPTEGIVEQGLVTVHSETLSFVGEPYPDGTRVRVSVGKEFYCESLDEIQRKKQERQRERDRREQERERQLHQQQTQNRQFNDSLHIPVKWRPEYKPVLSGLTASSFGDGHKRNTVYHVLLQEDLHEGRLHRHAGQLLCSTDMGKYGDLVEWHEHLLYDEVNVTCKTCLRIAQRWRNKEHSM